MQPLVRDMSLSNTQTEPFAKNGHVDLFDYDGIASYTGTLEGLAATSPSVTGRSLAARQSAVGEYRQYLGVRVLEETISQ